ncbi:MAG: N-acyl homoserine lactonase family protein [Desulforhopalus sp.]
MELKIKPLCVGRSKIDKSVLTYLRGQGTEVIVPHIIWAIEGGEKLIIVDSGPADPDTLYKERGHILDREGHEEPIKVLKNNGIDPSDVEIVIATHLHWDHCGNFSLFPNAIVYVQRRELEFAVAPLDIFGMVYEAAIFKMNPKWVSSLSRFQLLDGDVDLIPGVKLLSLPGHTPGLQGVLISTRKGIYCIPSDTVNIEENLVNNIPPGIHINIEDCYRSLGKIKRLADHVLPCHDMKILEKPEYP